MEEDGFATTKLFNHGYSYTYDDVIFLPHYIDFSTDDVSLSTCLTRWVPLLSSVLSSPMNTVTKGAMAAAMASLGNLYVQTWLFIYIYIWKNIDTCRNFKQFLRPNLTFIYIW